MENSNRDKDYVRSYREGEEIHCKNTDELIEMCRYLKNQGYEFKRNNYLLRITAPPLAKY